jgi:hypothetical protein
MSVIPCEQNKGLRDQIERFAEVLKTEAHKLGGHGLEERDFYNSGLFRGAVERVRGQFSATMRGKREFAQHALNHMEDGGFIAGWDLSDDANRNDYVVRLNSGRTAVIDLKGCLDGNNTNIFEHLLQSGSRSASQRMVGHPHAPERRDDLSQPASRWRRALGHGVWNDRSALPQTL